MLKIGLPAKHVALGLAMTAIIAAMAATNGKRAKATNADDTGAVALAISTGGGLPLYTRESTRNFSTTGVGLFCRTVFETSIADVGYRCTSNKIRTSSAPAL